LKFTYTQNERSSRRQPCKKLIYSTFTLPDQQSTIAGYVGEHRGDAEPPRRLQASLDASVLVSSRKFHDLSGYRTEVHADVFPLQDQPATRSVLQLINEKK